MYTYIYVYIYIPYIYTYIYGIYPGEDCGGGARDHFEAPPRVGFEVVWYQERTCSLCTLKTYFMSRTSRALK